LVRVCVQFCRQTAQGCRVGQHGLVYTVYLCNFFCGFKKEKKETFNQRQ